MIFKRIKKITNYNDIVIRMENAHNIFNKLPGIKKDVKTITFQLTEDCNLYCTYCYQTNKSKSRLNFDYAKRFIDMIIEDSYKENTFVSTNSTAGVIAEFIGGEPLLETKLMDQIVDYFIKRLTEEKHPWLRYFRISLISNGVNYFSKDFQNFLKKNEKIVSFGISLDGCKELHDACRVFNNGKGSYDVVVKACKHYMENYDDNMYTKMTFAPENIDYVYEAITNLISLGYEVIYCNPIYEDKWSNEDPIKYYNGLKRVADYVLDNELYNDIDISAFDDAHFKKVDLVNENRNYCGSTGSMLALDCRGDIYPCIRFMKSSLGTDIKPFKIGDIFNGINITKPDRERVNLLDSITYTSQSDNECINCPISQGCGWCTAYNYQATGTPNKRVKSICGMHKARALANVYYWNSIYKKVGAENRFEMNIPKEWALEIISEEEYEMLLELTK